MNDDQICLKKENIKHDWYQTDSTVTINVLIKHVKNEDFQVDFTSNSCTLSLQNRPALHFNLAQYVVPEKCTYKVTPSKIEIKLTKYAALRWNELENMQYESTSQCSTTSLGQFGRKNWESIERDIKAEEEKEKPEGEEAIQQLFQQIYGRGSDEVKKAMNKSFMESGGTVLSTNWDEIGKEKVEVKPPDGMEWKKW